MYLSENVIRVGVVKWYGFATFQQNKRRRIQQRIFLQFRANTVPVIAEQ